MLPIPHFYTKNLHVIIIDECARTGAPNHFSSLGLHFIWNLFLFSYWNVFFDSNLSSCVFDRHKLRLMISFDWRFQSSMSVFDIVTEERIKLFVLISHSVILPTLWSSTNSKEIYELEQGESGVLRYNFFSFSFTFYFHQIGPTKKKLFFLSQSCRGIFWKMIC